MKKNKLFVSALILSVAFVGCKSNEEEQKNESTPQEQTLEDHETSNISEELNPGDTVIVTETKEEKTTVKVVGPKTTTTKTTTKPKTDEQKLEQGIILKEKGEKTVEKEFKTDEDILKEGLKGKKKNDMPTLGE